MIITMIYLDKVFFLATFKIIPHCHNNFQKFFTFETLLKYYLYYLFYFTHFSLLIAKIILFLYINIRFYLN